MSITLPNRLGSFISLTNVGMMECEPKPARRMPDDLRTAQVGAKDRSLELVGKGDRLRGVVGGKNKEKRIENERRMAERRPGRELRDKTERGRKRVGRILSNDGSR